MIGEQARTAGRGRGPRRGMIAVACCLVVMLAALMLSGSGQVRLAGLQRGAGGRGSVVSYEQVAALSVSEARSYLSAAGYGSPAPAYGMRIYRVAYRTVGPHGEPVTASGVLVLPTRARRSRRVVAFEHGTLVAKAGAPSVDATSRGQVILLAGAGYAAVEPDYLG